MKIRTVISSCPKFCHDGELSVCYSVLQCVTVCCSVLQCVAVCCSSTSRTIMSSLSLDPLSLEMHVTRIMFHCGGGEGNF